MLWASLKLLANRDKVMRKEAKKIVSGSRREKNNSTFVGCSMGPIWEAKSPTIGPIDIMAKPILVSDRLAAKSPEQMIKANLPRIICIKGAEDVSKVSSVPRSFSPAPKLTRSAYKLQVPKFLIFVQTSNFNMKVNN